MASVVLFAVILFCAISALAKIILREEKDKRAKMESQISGTEAKVQELRLYTDAKIAEVSNTATQQIADAEQRLNVRIEKIESKVGGIVTGDIAQLYREITTLQGDIKVLASELKNLNCNIKTLFDTMSNDIRSTITSALSGN